MGSPSEPRSIARQVVTFGDAEILEFNPAPADEERDDAVRILKRDLDLLQIQIQTMTESHRSEVSGLQGKLTNLAQLMAAANYQIESNCNQIESNSRTMLANLASTLACPHHK